MYGSMFRHFFCDPTPAGIMRNKAPAVHEWVARMWNLDLHDFQGQAFPDECPADLQPLLNIVCEEFLPYMKANSNAYHEGRKKFEFLSKGVLFKLPAQRYRAWRYQRLCQRFQALDSKTQSAVCNCLPGLASFLGTPLAQAITPRITALPVAAATSVAGRAW
jgi:hypothetical protein